MRVINVPQPDFPEISYMKGNPVDGFDVVTFVAKETKGGVVTYEASFKGDAELTADESSKLAAVMRVFADKKGVSVDVVLKEAAVNELPSRK